MKQRSTSEWWDSLTDQQRADILFDEKHDLYAEAKAMVTLNKILSEQKVFKLKETLQSLHLPDSPKRATLSWKKILRPAASIAAACLLAALVWNFFGGESIESKVDQHIAQLDVYNNTTMGHDKIDEMSTGVYSFRNKDFEKALNSFNNVANQEDCVLRVNKGITLMRLERFQSAIENISSCAKKSEDTYIDALWIISLSQLSLNKEQEALENLDAILTYGPSHIYQSALELKAALKR